jgi:hypothetical protein
MAMPTKLAGRAQRCLQKRYRAGVCVAPVLAEAATMLAHATRPRFTPIVR